MSQQPQGVLIAIDWENIRRGAQLYYRNIKAGRPVPGHAGCGLHFR